MTATAATVATAARTRRGRLSTPRAVSIAACGVWLATTPAAAQSGDVDLDRGPAADLYIRRRPPVPESPKIPDALRAMVEAKEKEAIAKRAQAMALLEEFLATDPTGESRAEALFKLAELEWEEARRAFIGAMDRYERQLEACRVAKDGCAEKPKEPRIDLSTAEGHYRTLLSDHPEFRRTDLVLYLVGFAANETGNGAEALGYFQQVIERFPGSPLYGDAWMMIGERLFAAGQWSEARDAYANVLGRPEAATYDLALFKTAWCDWKLGDTDLAAQRFKKVLDLAVQAERSGSARVRQRRAQLRDEALDYLVIVFTEDRTISAGEVYKFLASIGGERYSRDVLTRVAEAYFNQADYERSVQTYKFLIELEPDRVEAARQQRRIVEAWVEALDDERTIAEIGVLVDGFGPGSKWAEKVERELPTRLARQQRLTEQLVRRIATDYHARAQKDEKRRKRPDLRLYQQAADVYAVYLTRFGQEKKAPEVRYLRAEILYFTMRKLEEAGDEYLAVGRMKPVGKYHKDALLKAMEAFEKARPKNVELAGKRELLPADRKFAEAVDLYATLFPADPELVGVVFRNGQMFYDYGDYDEAIKRFGLIVTKYPDDPNAGPAGDRILRALAKAEDYENIETWARRLKTAKAFQSADQQQRLDRLIVESIGKSGEKYAAEGKHAEAAGFYLRIPKEFPDHALAPSALMNAGVMYEKAKRPDAAARAYLSLADKYPRSADAGKAAFTAGKVYERVAYFDRAADAYEVVVSKFPRSSQHADALFNAGVLRQALGQHARAIEHYTAYARKYRKRKDASEVAFRIGVVYEETGDYKRADKEYRAYARRSRKDDPHVLEAHVRSARTALQIGDFKQAQRELKVALKMYKKMRPRERRDNAGWAAEARYHEGELIYRQFEKIRLDANPRRVQRTLSKKIDMLVKAQKVYLDVVEYEDLQWATAALYRMGRVFEEFAESLRDAPVPPGLSGGAAEEYKMALENEVVTVEEKAISMYRLGYDKALGLKVYNEYTRKIREALGRLDASNFPPLIEARGRTRYGDRPLAPRVVTEVIRDE